MLQYNDLKYTRYDQSWEMGEYTTIPLDLVKVYDILFITHMIEAMLRTWCLAHPPDTQSSFEDIPPTPKIKVEGRKSVGVQPDRRMNFLVKMQ